MLTMLTFGAETQLSARVLVSLTCPRPPLPNTLRAGGGAMLIFSKQSNFKLKQGVVSQVCTVLSPETVARVLMASLDCDILSQQTKQIKTGDRLPNSYKLAA